ncbi:hypothetical protein LSAT2_031086 [Lamellibrachia satsuma]|nr:hypothetical protein LSAT2_031086 [Lamellibrachia satsuma]
MLHQHSGMTIFVVLVCLLPCVSSMLFTEPPTRRALCGDRDYNPRYLMCCDEVLRPRFPGYKCCGITVYNPEFSICCLKTVVNHEFWMTAASTLTRLPCEVPTQQPRRVAFDTAGEALCPNHRQPSCFVRVKCVGNSNYSLRRTASAATGAVLSEARLARHLPLQKRMSPAGCAALCLLLVDLLVLDLLSVVRPAVWPRNNEYYAVNGTTKARKSIFSSGGSDMAMHTSGSVGASNGSTVPVEDAWSAFHVDVNTTRSENEANKGNHVPTEDITFYIAMGVIGGFTCLSALFGLYYMCRRTRSFSKTLYLVQELDAEAPINCLVSRRKLSNLAEVTRGRLQTVA